MLNPTGFIYINGTPFPYPSNESGLQTTVTLVDSARTADGVMRGRKIGRDQSKVELTWRVLEPEVWSEMLEIFDNNFTFTIRYWDMVSDGWKTRIFYVGDRSAQPFIVKNGRPTYWLNCKANVIDTGEGG